MQLLTILLEGEQRSGKTALAAQLALESDFPYVKMISPENFVGVNEHAKIHTIVKIFEDAYKSTLSLIILDDIERLIEFIHIGPRFSNLLLQALLVLVKKTPPNLDRKLMIIGTTSMKDVMQDMAVIDCFNVCLKVHNIFQKEEFEAVLKNFTQEETVIDQISTEVSIKYALDGLTIKNLMLAIDLSIQKSESGQIEHQTFMDSLDSIQN